MKPSKIYTLGDYYKDDLKDICHLVKSSWTDTKSAKVLIARLLFDIFKDKIPQNSLMIPIKSNGNFPNITSQYFEQHGSFVDAGASIFGYSSWLTFYGLKRQYLVEHIKLTMDDNKLTLINHPANFESFSNVVLIDNVIGTGCTVAKAMKLLDRQCEVLCIAVDWKTFNSYNF